LVNGTERLGAWIANNPIIIIALAVLLTFASFHYAQQIEVRGFETESFVGKESPLYQIFDHLFVERFGTESVVVLIEGEDVAAAPVLEATLRLSDHMKEAPGVIGVQSIADLVASAEAGSGVRGSRAGENRFHTQCRRSSHAGEHHARPEAYNAGS
jgi:predicted RND superfamily exporter protein